MRWWPCGIFHDKEKQNQANWSTGHIDCAPPLFLRSKFGNRITSKSWRKSIFLNHNCIQLSKLRLSSLLGNKLFHTLQQIIFHSQAQKWACRIIMQVLLPNLCTKHKGYDQKYIGNGPNCQRDSGIERFDLSPQLLCRPFAAKSESTNNPAL